MAENAWEILEQGALWALEHAAELSPRSQVEGRRPILRLWTYSPQGFVSWTILVPIGPEAGCRPLVREVHWQRRLDEERLESMNRKHTLRRKLRANLQVRYADISSEDLDPFLDAAERLILSSGLAGESALQGDRSGFEGYHSLAYLRMEWQGPGPVEQSEAIAWAVHLRELLVASLRERERA